MVDIKIAIFTMSILCGLLFLLSFFIHKNLGKTGRHVFAVGTILFIVLHIFVLADSVWWIKIFPLKAIIVYSNLLIPLSGVLCGIIWTSRKLPKYRRLLAIVLLLFLAFTPTTKQVFFKQLQFHEIWNDEICIQSRQTSCAPASATTLLKHYGIETTEQQIAQLSLTRPDGTSLFGIYRAFKIKTQNSEYRVDIGKVDSERLRNDVTLPAILILCLDNETNKRDPRYAEKWGWGVGITHSVVLFGFTGNNQIEVGDPSIGREVWNRKALDDLWNGEYITIKKNDAI